MSTKYFIGGMNIIFTNCLVWQRKFLDDCGNSVKMLIKCTVRRGRMCGARSYQVKNLISALKPRIRVLKLRN